MNEKEIGEYRARRVTPANEGLFEIFLYELAEMRSAEKQLTIALPILAKFAKSEDLKALIEIHLKETEGHVVCIDQVAGGLGAELPKGRNRAMTNLIKEAVAVMLKERGTSVSDQALIASAQKVEHYEIAAYGSLCAWAEQLGLTHEYALLESTLGQEKIANALLTGLATENKPLQELIEHLSLKKAGADFSPEAQPV